MRDSDDHLLPFVLVLVSLCVWKDWWLWGAFPRGSTGIYCGYLPCDGLVYIWYIVKGWGSKANCSGQCGRVSSMYDM